MPSLDEYTMITDRLTRAAARLEALSQQAEALIADMTQARRALVAAVKAASIEWQEPATVVAHGYDTAELNRIAAEHAAMWRGRRKRVEEWR